MKAAAKARIKKRAERNLQRAALRAALTGLVADLTRDDIVDRTFPAPPPEHTYGSEVFDPAVGMTYRRRSDGVWFCDKGQSARTDASVRALAAEVPLTDTECEYLLGVAAANRCCLRLVQHTALRAAFVRVMRGEVKP